MTQSILKTLAAAIVLSSSTAGLAQDPPPKAPPADPPPPADHEKAPDADRPPKPGDRDDEVLREPRGDTQPGPLIFSDDNDDDKDDFRRFRMSEDDVAEARKIIAELYPDLSPRLDELSEEDPERLRRTLERRFPRVRYLVTLKQHDRESFDLRMADIDLGRRADVLAKKWDKAKADGNADQAGELEQQLETTIAEHFDIRQQIRRKEIDYLQWKVDSLEKRLDERQSQRDTYIQQRLDELKPSSDKP